MQMFPSGLFLKYEPLVFVLIIFFIMYSFPISFHAQYSSISYTLLTDVAINMPFPKILAVFHFLLLVTFMQITLFIIHESGSLI